MQVQEHPTIRDLILARKEVTGWSNQDLEHASGDRVSRQTINNLLNKSSKAWPKTNDTVMGLADALDVTPEVVILAWATSLGLPIKMRQPMLALQIPPSADTLNVGQRNAIIALIRQFTGQSAVDATPAAAADAGAGAEPATAATAASAMSNHGDVVADRGDIDDGEAALTERAQSALHGVVRNARSNSRRS